MIDITNPRMEDFARAGGLAPMAKCPARDDFRTAVINVIPMAFLEANGPAGATGPSAATDVVQAIRDMVALSRKAADRAWMAEARVAVLEGHIRDFITALDRGYLACKDDSAFIDALRTAVTK